MAVNAKIDLSTSLAPVTFTPASVTSMFVGQENSPYTILDDQPFQKSVYIANPPNTPYYHQVFIDGRVPDGPPGGEPPPDIIVTPASGNTVWHVGTVSALKVTTLSPIPQFPNLNALIANAYTHQSQVDAAFQNAVNALDQWYETVGGAPFKVMLLAHLNGFRANVEFSEARTLTEGQSNSLNVPDLFDGNNIITGSSFGDVIDAGKGTDTVFAGEGDDTVIGGAGPDTLDGGGGTDTLSYAGSTVGVKIALNGKGGATVSGGDAAGDKISNFEIIIGSGLNDTLLGDGLANTIYGGAGDDIIRGGPGGDKLDGGEGSDTLSYEFASIGAWVNIDLKYNVAQVGDAEGDKISGFENIIGTSAGDWFVAGEAANLIDGRADTGGLESDTVSYAWSAAGVNAVLNLTTAVVTSTGGDAEGDRLVNIENLVGSSHNDTLVGNSLANSIEGGEGDDVIRGGAGADILDGGAGIDTLSYEGSVKGVTASLFFVNDFGAQVVSGGDAQGDSVRYFENLIGGKGNDVLSVNIYANTILGGEGNDIIRAYQGGDILDGGLGIDTLSYQDTFGLSVTVDLAANTAKAAVADTISGFENLTGSSQSDLLYGDDQKNTINGGMGQDLIEGRGGDDTLIGGGDLDDADTIDGGEGNDKISGGGGNDTLIGGAGKDVLDGGSSFGGNGDTVDYSGSGAGVTITLGNGAATTVGKGGDAEGDQLKSIESIIGSDFADKLTANAVNNRIDAGDGDDYVVGIAQAIVSYQFDEFHGGDGLDTLSLAGAKTALNIDLVTNSVSSWAFNYFATISGFEKFIGGSAGDTMHATLDGGPAVTFIGGAGNDKLRGSAGHDTLDGGLGIDTLSFSPLAGGVSVDLQSNVVIGSGNDAISNFENIDGTSSGDALRGNKLSNFLHGKDGDDLIEGRAGADKLDGGAGINTLSYESSVAAVTVSLGLDSSEVTLGKGGDAQGDQIVNFHNIIGGLGNDGLSGNNLANILDGKAGNDVLTGGSGADIFVVGLASGTDTIIDFEAGSKGGADKIDVQAFTQFADYAALLGAGAISQQGGAVVIALDATTKVLLNGLATTDIGENDFVFAVPAPPL